METLLPAPSAFLTTCLLVTLVVPLISFLLSFLISEKYSWIVTFSAPFFMLLSTLSAALIFYNTWNQPAIILQWEWLSGAGINFTLGILVDNMSAVMLFVVTLIALLVNVYSTGYMAGDPDLKRYFAMLAFFTFSMLGVVVADSLLLIFVFWELVGFSSYILIGHWREKPEAADAAKRAFIFNRIGDAGFLIGLMIIWSATGTFALHDLEMRSEPGGWQTAAALCIFCGVIGKSAQFPLFAWLPAAMEGPTPVSALIHAATMVAAGIFLIARIFFLFTPDALDVVAITGCLTALLGALAALFQYDIKKILAYSTISQLGLMVVALGAGAPEAAMLHLFNHAFFKACLFLAAGSVIHSLHQAQHQSHATFDVQDIRNLGGLQRKMPFTFLVFVMSGSALAGVPFFSGFLSKDAILTALLNWKGHEYSWRWLIFLLAFAVSFITVLYTFRMIWSVFKGEETLTKDFSVSEAPPAMRAPMMFLAVASIWLVTSWNPFDFSGWLYTGLQHTDVTHASIIPIASALWVLLALWTAYITRTKTWSSPILHNAFYLDRLYSVIIEKPAYGLAGRIQTLDKKWIDGVLHAAAYFQLLIAHITGWFDRALVDGTVNGVAYLSREIGSFTRSFQSGKIQLYIFWAVFAIIIFIIWTLL